MDVFAFRDRLIGDYSSYVRSFIHIRDPKIAEVVATELDEGALWPQPLIQLNPSFEPGDRIEGLVDAGVLHAKCRHIFRTGKTQAGDIGRDMRLHRHQTEAIHAAATGANYVLTTGTGSGKSLAYIVPIVDRVLRRGSGHGIQAIVVYPMNALANSQAGELEKFLTFGYGEGKSPVTYACYTGQERDEAREQIQQSPPDILLTNYVMLELILTRCAERRLVEHAQGLQFLVLDELHTYRGRQGADVALLVRRTRDALNASTMQCVGTSATVAGAGTVEEQKAQVARAASLLFGAEVRPENVIGETLRRATAEPDAGDPEFVSALRARVADAQAAPPAAYQEFVDDPLSRWLESAFGIRRDDGSGRLARAEPRAVAGPEGAALMLATLTGESALRCEEAIRAGLLGGYGCERDPVTDFPVFAFRLHQFISRGDAVYASPQSADGRHVTVYGQQFVPGDKSRALLPLVFCRECGQEYYCVRRTEPEAAALFRPRDLGDQVGDENGAPVFLYMSDDRPWPGDPDEFRDRVPDDWWDAQSDAVRRDYRKSLPQPVRVGRDGREAPNGEAAHWFPSPFRFCLRCGISYTFSQKDDFAKLTPLSSEGRSTATTVLSLAAVHRLRSESSLNPEARKLLSFTDNRQDASLQAGHFNDFVEIGLLRSALYRAAAEAGDDGLNHEDLAQRVFAALDVPKEQYAANPEAKFNQLKETERALRSVLAYRLYRDLRRGWRVTSPNLEQCGLLEIRYSSLEELCADGETWQRYRPARMAAQHGGEELVTGLGALTAASPQTRAQVARTLLDYMRRELAVKVDYLDADHQERLKQQSSQYLVPPWAIDEDEKLQTAFVLYPRPRRKNEQRDNLYLSPRGAFGQYLRRARTFPHVGRSITVQETEAVIDQLLHALTVAGLVERVTEPGREEPVAGFQLPASAMVWVAGDGTRGYRDPIRVPSGPEAGARTNPFFVEFYRTAAGWLGGMEAHEHTAQVPYEERRKREDDFRAAALPVLYCSPTMELGVDIASLNVVNMRNIPPTPANYAQRSGRAGRSGQPALVFSYCSTGSPHDQYFFKRPERMVAGAVTPPRLDLANEDLIRAHVHAIWLAESGMSLGKALRDLLEVASPDDSEPTLAVLESVRADIEAPQHRSRARERAARVVSAIEPDLRAAGWYDDGWLERTMNGVSAAFDAACQRWRDLYLAALRQARAQNRIIHDAARPARDKEQAQRLRREAEEQLRLLTEVGNVAQSDFYTYRYFASEGFLPGYSFPRLPLSAFIPARSKRLRDEFLSRPRFLAISEFGPRAIVYHEGSQYEINRAILPVVENGEDDALTRQAKLCPSCGYLHPLDGERAFDVCERCGVALDAPMTRLFRLQNVSTRRRQRISSDEEERMRRGYEMLTGVRFEENGGIPAYRSGRVERDGEPLAELAYGQTATVWRINLGWRRREHREVLGFVLDMETGVWARDNHDAAEGDQEDPRSTRTVRVIPYVDDRRNCLLFAPSAPLEVSAMASLQAALKSAMQVVFQLEDNELATEPLPKLDDRRLLLFYEAAEGGAGVLRRLLDEPGSLARVAHEALSICHFDPDTGEDKRRALSSREDCEAACYNCLLSYANQQDHEILDRHSIRDFLMSLRSAQVAASPAPQSREAHLARLVALCDSELERNWLRYLEARRLRLPTHAQCLIEAAGSRPDFAYLDGGTRAAVYIDGPPHDFPDRQARDRAQAERWEDLGYAVVRFRHQDDWDAKIRQFPTLFGAPHADAAEA